MAGRMILPALATLALAACARPAERHVFTSEKAAVAVATRAPAAQAERPTFTYVDVPVDSELEAKLQAAFNDLAAWVAYALQLEPFAKPPAPPR